MADQKFRDNRGRFLSSINHWNWKGGKPAKRPYKYGVWATMKARCNNPNFSEYPRYGGRGIRVCKDWSIYENFARDMLPSYKIGLSLDRIDNNGNYCKENCRWVNIKQQANNRRNNRLITFNGITKTISEWSDYTGIKSTTLRQRLDTYRWPIDKTLTEGAIYVG